MNRDAFEHVPAGKLTPEQEAEVERYGIPVFLMRKPEAFGVAVAPSAALAAADVVEW